MVTTQESTCRLEQILEAKPHKIVAVRSMNTHLTNYPRKTNQASGTLLEKKELRNDLLIWAPIQGHVSVDRPAKTSIYQFCVDIGCSLEDLPGVTADSDG